MPRIGPLPRLAAGSLFLVVGLGSGRAVALDPPPPRFQLQPAEPPLPLLPRPVEPATLDLGVRIGGAVRVGDAPAFPVTQRGGYMVGAGVTLSPSPRFGVGLAYEHSSLGSEFGKGDLAIVDLSRRLDAVWLGLRLSLVRAGSLDVAVSFGPGLAFQATNASVRLLDPTAKPPSFTCSGSGSPGLGLRAGVGAQVRLGPRFVVGADTVVDNLRLSSDPLGTCAPGAGSVTMIGLRLGLAYRIDVTRVVR